MLNLGLSPFSVTMLGGSDPIAHIPFPSELIAAWEADYGITLNAGNVAAWVPKAVLSGETPASLALVQGTAGKQPIYAANRGDGLPGIVHDGVDDFLQSLTVGDLVPTSGHCLAIACTFTATGSRFLCLANSSASERAIDCYRNGVNVQDIPIKASVQEGTMTIAAPTAGAWRTQTHWRSGTSMRFRRAASTTPLTSAQSTKGASPRLTIGAFSDGSAVSPISVSAIWLYKSGVDDAVVKAAMEARWPDYG